MPLMNCTKFKKTGGLAVPGLQPAALFLPVLPVWSRWFDTVFLATEFHIPLNQAPSPSLFETTIWTFNRCSNRNLFAISGCAISSLRFR